MMMLKMKKMMMMNDDDDDGVDFSIIQLATMPELVWGRARPKS